MTTTTQLPAGAYIDDEWPDGTWDDGDKWGPTYCADLTPGALADAASGRDVDRVVAMPYFDGNDPATVVLLAGCEHETTLTVDEADAYAHAILAAVAATRERVATVGAPS